MRKAFIILVMLIVGITSYAERKAEIDDDFTEVNIYDTTSDKFIISVGLSVDQKTTKEEELNKWRFKMAKFHASLYTYQGFRQKWIDFLYENARDRDMLINGHILRYCDMIKLDSGFYIVYALES